MERLVENQARKKLSLRFLSLVDSNVSRGALSKGRSASHAARQSLPIGRPAGGYWTPQRAMLEKLFGLDQ